MKRRGIFAAVLLVLSVVLAADAPASDVTVTATVQPQSVAVGEQAKLVVSIQGKFRKSGGPELPPLDDFDVYEAGSSQNFSMINGSVSSSVSFSYILVPRNEGTFKIEPIRFTVGDKVYTADPVTLNVVKGRSSIGAPPAQQQQQRRDSDTGQSAQGRNLFIEASVDRDTVYVNQQITWTLGFFTDGRVQLVQSPSYYPPESEGFWEEDLPPVRKFNTTIDNTQYLVNEVKRAYFPTAPGDFTIGSARVDVRVDDWSASSRNDFFRRPLRSFGFGTPKTLTTKPVHITVLPLPQAGKPADFSGIVAGDLAVDMRADKQTVQVGEPVNVTVQIQGRGNMKTMAVPPLKDIDGFKVYESGSSSNISKDDYTVSGSKKYEYVLVPKVEGNKQIPALRISYFDPVDKRYKTAKTSPIILDVQPGVQEEGRRIVFAGGDDQIEVLARDIHYIHSVPAVLAVNPSPLYGNSVYRILHIVPLLAVLLALVGERRNRRWRDNYRLARSEHAAREALKKLNAAGKDFRRGDTESLYSAVSSALWGYLADKMNVSPAGLTLESAEAFLQDGGAGTEEIAAFKGILTTCDAAKYAAGASMESRAGEVVRDAERIVKSLEKHRLG